MNDALHAELALLRELGFTHLDLSRVAKPASPEVSEQENVVHAETRRRGDEVRATKVGHAEARRRGEEGTPWEALMAEAHDCTACRLAGTRTNVVFGVGSPTADLMFIGEAPGRDEDE